jgi:solute carrier family 25 folate transporter 32
MPEDNTFLNGVIGAASGGVAALVTHPFDTIKTRFQANDGRGSGFVTKYSGVADAVVQICRVEGYKALYKGFLPSFLGSVCAWGLYMWGYNLTRSVINSSFPNSPTEPSKAQKLSVNFVSAAAAGIISATLTNPLWLIKTRLQLQADAKSPRYSGVIHCARCIIKDEGAAGLFRGLLPGLLLVSHGAVQFMAYEELKSIWGESEARDLNSGHYLVLGATSKVIASVATYPFQVIRTRLQMQRSAATAQLYAGVAGTTKQIALHEGVGGFYKGLVPNLIRVVPSSAITLTVYEGLSKLFNVKT